MKPPIKLKRKKETVVVVSYFFFKSIIAEEICHNRELNPSVYL